MRRTILLLAATVGTSLAFTGTSMPVMGLRAGSSGVVCSMTSNVPTSRRAFLIAAGAAGVVANPQFAFAKKAAPVAELEDLDEVDEEEDAEFQAQAKAAYKKQLADEAKAGNRAGEAQALRPVDAAAAPKKGEEAQDWKSGIVKSLQQGQNIKKLRKDRNEMCEVLGRGC